jgi:predicted ATPase
MKSLISTTVINESTYYRLLDSTRAHAAAKLAERDEADRIARRHASRSQWVIAIGDRALSAA